MVSARLFGGVPETYLAVHNAFDMSKAALGDMRHRAALHSVDHGLAVMRLIFPDRIGKTSLEELCVQHVHDDQGFSVRLDDWLRECDSELPSIARRAPRKLEAFLEAPEEAAAQRWGGYPEDYAAICAYFGLPETVSDHPLAPAVSHNAFGVYFSEMAFGSVISVSGPGQRPRYVSVRDIGETLALARFGHLKSLGDVLASMKRRNWMTGSRVARSRARRCRAAQRSDLFSEDSDGLKTSQSAGETCDALRDLLAD